MYPRHSAVNPFFARATAELERYDELLFSGNSGGRGGGAEGGLSEQSLKAFSTCT
jgi:hypothetical protein